MIVRPKKICDGCQKVVATKYLYWHTQEDYITIRTDEVPGYACYEASTLHSELHYCRECWNTITEALPYKCEVVSP